VLGPKCLHAAAEYHKRKPQEDGPAQVVENVIEIKDNQLSIVVGVLVKNTPSRPTWDDLGGYHATIEDISYLGEPYEEYGDEPSKPKKRAWEFLRSYCSSTGSDSLFLEDRSGRIELTPHQVVLDGSRCSSGTEGLLKEEMESKDQGRFKGYSCPHSLDSDAIATGVVVAVVGKMRPGTGIMEVHSLHFPPPPPPFASMGLRSSFVTDMEIEHGYENSSDPLQHTGEPRYIMLLSGLHCGAPDNDPTGSSLLLVREMLTTYLLGNIDPEVASKICRVIIAGGACSRPPRPGSFNGSSPYGSWNTNSSHATVGKERANPSKISAMAAVALPIRELDLFLSELCAVGLPVDLIPGLHDPTNAHWPQAALHPCLLPTASRYVNMIHLCANPYEAVIGDKLVLGSDGANIADLRKYIATSNVSSDDSILDESSRSIHPTSEMDTLHCSLVFSHMAPTGPDSLPTYPANELDPFVIETTPDIYFAGNCARFESREVTRVCVDGKVAVTRLICIPSFAETRQAVLLDLTTLDCTVVEFDDVCDSPPDDDETMEQ
jgi:DNA polymerase delta subunit 2